MAFVPVEIVNNSGQTVGMTLEEDGEMLAYFRKQVRAESLHSVKVLRPAPARKPAPAKP
ncbi:hypothetical protein PV729_04195 [Streptomyces europaeiscabiei]|uniref:Uncharacterized protein n=1 Tax=Streptomyces europaeiscabiei TaxID=146819 RepID=A0ABU4N8D3_9ACTN|nr:hypothetical protein [Streptomyces europaeiscabiei]MDX3550978.1 hypothetical protein [Streptomyces europaeiscabiei]MDX3698462.1 hypothetical protein [Streptomyces europaeiscabiei]